MLYRGKDKKEFYLASLLYDSIEYRHLDSITSLLTEKGADANVVLPKKGISPFHLIIGCESYEFTLTVTSLILQNGGNPNVRSDDGLTPVHLAAAWGRSELLKLLLNCGGNPECRDVNGKTPFYYAAEEGFFDCIKVLRSYLPGKNDIAKREGESKGSCLIFDKILVNDGSLVGEYRLSTADQSDSIISPLQSLPITNTTENILNWFSRQKSVSGTCPETNLENLSSKSSYVESDDSNIKPLDPITFRKLYRKKRSTNSYKTCSPKNSTVYLETKDVLNEESCSDKANFKESGIVSLSVREVNSDYLTCSDDSINCLEKNICDNLSLDKVPRKSNVVGEEKGNEVSFVGVSEVFKYVDKDKDVVLYERRLLRGTSGCANSVKSSNVSSGLSSLPESFDYDTDALRKELTVLGFSPGPITLTTKKVYLKKLYQLRKCPVRVASTTEPKKKVYSLELEKTIRNAQWHQDTGPYKSLEEILVRQFSNPDPSRKWRGGVNKTSFTYLLLDPRITTNLPYRVDVLQTNETWETFLASIFYIGKGKRSRPYQHLYEAVKLWKNEYIINSKKLETIIDIWKDGSGVICLHVFLNVIPVEAYTREAAMISAIKLENLTNVKSGEFYGLPATWPQRQKKMLGVYLLYKALMIFLNEGERQLYPCDIE